MVRHRYTVVEVTGLDRPGLLYELTATLSKLNLNIASAHVATFGERVVDVFYVTDLTGAQIATPTRQAAIKRPLLALFSSPGARGQAAREAAAITVTLREPLRAARGREGPGNRPLNRALYRRRRAFCALGTGHGVATGGRKRTGDAAASTCGCARRTASAARLGAGAPRRRRAA